MPMSVGIITEKISARENFEKALGGRTGSFNGDDYVLANAAGHLFQLDDPSVLSPQVDNRNWSVSALPWDDALFDWNYVVSPGKAGTLKAIEMALADCDEIVLGGDIDPTGEGDHITWEIIDALGWHDKKISRMEFLDESEKSIQDAFVNRRPITGMWDEGPFLMSEFRGRWDMLSMQWTRMLTDMLKSTGRYALLRNGRLKSAMNRLVGDRIDAHNNWVKKPWYNWQFTDDHGVKYTWDDEPRHEKKSDVEKDKYHDSGVTKDGTKKKSTPPPKLLNFSQLTALMGKKGYSPGDVSGKYQVLYQDQVLSYPRTADSFVSPEQFNDMLPNIDKIAGIVGVDPAKLTHRTPRKGHVKTGGAHGANRPGPVVPASLDAIVAKYGQLGADIYVAVGKNYLTMLAEDYLYQTHSGHVTDYPDFTGSVSEPLDPGWKDIMDVDRGDGDDTDGSEDDNSAHTLGTTATPEVHEGFPPRPGLPTQTWLSNQLTKLNIGTGATQVSTLEQISESGNKKSLMRLSKSGGLSLTDAGELNHRLLVGTNIADLTLTKKVFEQMDRVADKSLDMSVALAEVKDLVVADIPVVQANADAIGDDVAPKLLGTAVMDTEKVTGTSVEYGEVTFKRTWAGHRFTDGEVADLLAGKKIAFDYTDRNNVGRSTAGYLRPGVYKKKNYFGYTPDDNDDGSGGETASGTYTGTLMASRTGTGVEFPKGFDGKPLTDVQVTKLLAGEIIKVTKGSMRRRVALVETNGSVVAHAVNADGSPVG